MKDKGLVLLSHGSLLCGSGAVLKLHAQTLRQNGQYVAVEPGYLNYCHPPVEEAVERCVAAGARKIIIVPFFLVAGKFVQHDLPLRMKQVKKQFHEVKFEITRALEDSPAMELAVVDLLKTAESPEAWQHRAKSTIRGACELRQSCPLYGTMFCKSAESADM